MTHCSLPNNENIQSGVERAAVLSEVESHCSVLGLNVTRVESSARSERLGWLLRRRLSILGRYVAEAVNAPA
jgi:hypothetical protein